MYRMAGKGLSLYTAATMRFVLQSPPVQKSMSGRISTKVTFPKRAHYVKDYGSIVKKII